MMIVKKYMTIMMNLDDYGEEYESNQKDNVINYQYENHYIICSYIICPLILWVTLK